MERFRKRKGVWRKIDEVGRFKKKTCHKKGDIALETVLNAIEKEELHFLEKTAPIINKQEEVFKSMAGGENLVKTTDAIWKKAIGIRLEINYKKK